MELKKYTPLLIFLKVGVSKSTFDNLSEYFGLNPEVYYTIPESRMNTVWGRINSNSNKVILARYDDRESMRYVLDRIISKILSNSFHILVISHEDIYFETYTIKILERYDKEYDLILMQNKKFSKL